MSFGNRPHEELQACFQNTCPDSHWEITLVAPGASLSLQGFLASWQGEHDTPSREDVARYVGRLPRF